MSTVIIYFPSNRFTHTQTVLPSHLEIVLATDVRRRRKKRGGVGGVCWFVENRGPFSGYLHKCACALDQVVDLQGWMGKSTGRYIQQHIGI